MPEVIIPGVLENVSHAWHLFIILLDIDRMKINRDEFLAKLKEENIGTGIHFKSIPNSTYYSKTFGYKPEDFPNASYVSERILSLPLYPKMSEQDILDVIKAVTKVVNYYRK
jgi:dTDP-4-amino-4,6-dideoxygalactose transaminase